MTLLLVAVLAASPANPAEVHQSAVVIDTHADTTGYLLDAKVDFVQPGRDDLHLDWPKAKAGNLGGEFFSIWVDPKPFAGQYAHRALAMIDSVLEQVRRHPEQLQLALTADEVVAAKKAGKLAVLLGVEGGHAIENDLGVLRSFHRLGVRYMTLTWSNTNEWADSSGDLDDKKVKHHGGLSPFGEQVVREMNRLGMIVDVSHVADATLADVLALTAVPVIASHSSARALCDHPRNISDDLLKAIAKNGGVVQVNFFSGFVDCSWMAQWKKGAPERKKAQGELLARLKDKTPGERDEELFQLSKRLAAKLPRPPFKILIDHIDHVAKTAGVDHVGLGSDFDGIYAMPEGMDGAAQLPKITAALLERGYTPAQVHQILGGNTLRVMRAVEKASQAGSGSRAP